MLEIAEFLRFAIVGLWNTILDISLFLVLVHLIEKTAVKKIWFLKTATIAHILVFIVVNFQSFFLNSIFTFTNATNNRGWLPFLMVSIVSLTLSSIIIQVLNKNSYYLFVRKLINNTSFSEKHFLLLIKIVAVIITMFCNYFGYRFFVF